jgi:hypothetical protein
MVYSECWYGGREEVAKTTLHKSAGARVNESGSIAALGAPSYLILHFELRAYCLHYLILHFELRAYCLHYLILHFELRAYCHTT